MINSHKCIECIRCVKTKKSSTGKMCFKKNIEIDCASLECDLFIHDFKTIIQPDEKKS